MAKKIILVLGGVRSGKTAWAEGCALTLTPNPYYCATGIAGDDAMAARIARHREARDAGFTTIEEPDAIAAAIRARKDGEVMLVDSLGAWLTNMMMRDENIAAASDDLLAACVAAEASLVIVSEEVGLGVLPANKMARDFADHLGSLNQRMAAGCADTVVLLAAGIPLALKGVMP